MNFSIRKGYTLDCHPLAISQICLTFYEISFVILEGKHESFCGLNCLGPGFVRTLEKILSAVFTHEYWPFPCLG